MPQQTGTPIDTVVVTHRGFKPYLGTCLRRAAIAAGRGRVVLIGDAEAARAGIGTHHPVDDPALQADLDELRGVYRMVSRSHSLERERFWAERWFLIRNFMRRENLDGCLAIDSDVLLFCDVGEESLRFAPYAMTFGRWDPVRVVPHCNFIRGRAAIEDLCRFILDAYRDPRTLERLASLNRKRDGSAWISDMSLLASWAATSGFPVGFLEDTVADGVGFDSCLDHVGGYASCNYLPGVMKPWKRLRFRDGVPYGTIRASGLEIPMKCVHYHGHMKLLMKRHDRGEEDDWTAAGTLATGKLADYPMKARIFCRNYVAPWLTGAAGRRAAA